MLLQDEVARRDQRKFDTLLRQAHFRNHKTLEDFAFDRLPNLNRSLVHDLATGRYLQEQAPFLIVGPCGTGKSHIAQGRWGIVPFARGWTSSLSPRVIWWDL